MNLAVVVATASRVLHTHRSSVESRGSISAKTSGLLWNRPTNTTLGIALHTVQGGATATVSMPKSGAGLIEEEQAFALKAAAWTPSDLGTNLGILITKEVRHDMDAV
jgi:hypothetical protein